MSKIFRIIYFLVSVVLGSCATQKNPQKTISNGLIKTKLYLPDKDNGYYRAARFDWSGIIPELEFDGHTYFGQWFITYDPKVHESVMGPVEEFAPVGYGEAKIGEVFLKIGVGTLIKPKEPDYFLFNPYEISNSGKWKIDKKSNSISFKHILEDSSYSYEYNKTIVLPLGKSDMVLDHHFTNTGTKIIETQVYNHNFFLLDNEIVGPGYEITFPFDIKGSGEGVNTFAVVEKNKIKFIETLGETDNVHLKDIKGFSTSADDHDIKIENKKTKAGVRINCDRPISKLVFWSAHKTVCPEPYIKFKVAPGESFSWKINYHFYSL